MTLEKVTFWDHVRIIDGPEDVVNPTTFTIYGEVVRETDLFIVLMANRRAPIFPEVGGPRNYGWLILKSAIKERIPLQEVPKA